MRRGTSIAGQFEAVPENVGLGWRRDAQGVWVTQPARAFGGPVRAGLPYLVNETTPRSEWFVPSASGGILNLAQAQKAFRSHLSAMGPRPLSRLQSGAPGAGGAKGNVSVHIHGNITISVPQRVTDP